MIWVLDIVLCAIAGGAIVLALRVPRGPDGTKDPAGRSADLPKNRGATGPRVRAPENSGAARTASGHR
jgi:hypothetical protein